MTIPPASAGDGNVVINFLSVTLGSVAVIVCEPPLNVLVMPVFGFGYCRPEVLVCVLPALALVLNHIGNKMRNMLFVVRLSFVTVIGLLNVNVINVVLVTTLIGASVPEKFIVSVIAPPAKTRLAGIVSVTTSAFVVPSGKVMASEYVTVSPNVMRLPAVSASDVESTVFVIVGVAEVKERADDVM